MKKIDYDKLNTVDPENVINNLILANSQLNRNNAILIAQVQKYKELTEILFKNVPEAFPKEITKESEENGSKR